MEPASISGLKDGFRKRNSKLWAHGVVKIKTLSQVIDVQTPFYKVLVRDRDGSCHTFFVLATEDIGHRQKASVLAIYAMAKILKIDPHYIYLC